MAQRFTLDRQSFEQFLAAASLVQQFQKQAVRSGRSDVFAQPLLELVDTQKAIDTGSMDADSAVERIVRLALRVVGGEGTAVWLFSNDEFVYRAGSGRKASHDERLRLTVLARVAAVCDPSRESFPGQREWAKGAGDSGYYPGAVRSLVVGPIYQNQTVVGALAAFSSDFDAFDQRDAGNIRLLSGLIGNAMERSLAAQTRTVVALPRQQVLRLIEQIVPTLQKLVRQEEFATTTLPQVADSFVKEDQVSESPAQQPVALQPVSAESVEEVAPHIKPVAEPEPASVLHVILDPVLEQKPVYEEETAPALNTAALTDELARLSRNIAEIENPTQIAESTAELLALSEEVSQATTVNTVHPQDAVVADAAPVLNEDATSVAPSPQIEPAIEQLFTIDDTAVPGIGVRAALYDDEEKQPSRFWPTIRQVTANAAQFFRRAFAAMHHGVARLGSSISASGRNLGEQVRKASTYRPHFPDLPTQKVGAVYRTARSSVTAATSRTRGQLSRLGQHRPKLPTVQTEALRHHVNAVGESLRRTAAKTATRINSLVNSFPDLPGFPTAPAKRQFEQAHLSAAQSLQQASIRANRIQNYRLRIRLNGRALQRSASAFAILVVMSAFLIMESGLFRTDSTASASARESQTKSSLLPEQSAADKASTSHTLANASSQHTAGIATTPVPAGPTSHRTITDPGTEDIVQNLTRYEVSTLRRQAESGDEEAAFQLGMAYEIGYTLSQNCAKAAEWVTKAAENGYPAAQYNLGLRYRDGDGVIANPSESQKWLSKAAARKYRAARAALATLTAQDRPTGK
jgi:TPR repeat protein